MEDVLIVGAGVSGMLSALELHDRGVRVALLDAGTTRPPASWAGGGILSPLFPWRYPAAMVPLTRHARRDYHYWRERILACGGRDPELLDGGMLILDDDPQAVRWAAMAGVSLERVYGDEAFPWLGAVPAMWMPEVARVRNPRLLEGLRALLLSAGINIHAVRVDAIKKGSGSVQVLTSEGALRAGKVVVTAGAWSRALLPDSSLPELLPVRGQMLMFAPPQHFADKVLLAPEGYLIPRADGKLLAGSTIEPGIDDSVPTQQAFVQLQQMAQRLYPALKDQQPVAQWAGIRPGSSRLLPVIGEVPESGGRMWVNTGHYRNGLVCAPASARLLAQLICSDRPGVDPVPYSVSGSSSSPP